LTKAFSDLLVSIQDQLSLSEKEFNRLAQEVYKILGAMKETHGNENNRSLQLSFIHDHMEIFEKYARAAIGSAKAYHGSADKDFSATPARVIRKPADLTPEQVQQRQEASEGAAKIKEETIWLRNIVMRDVTLNADQDTIDIQKLVNRMIVQFDIPEADVEKTKAMVKGEFYAPPGNRPPAKWHLKYWKKVGGQLQRIGNIPAEAAVDKAVKKAAKSTQRKGKGKKKKKKQRAREEDDLPIYEDVGPQPEQPARPPPAGRAKLVYPQLPVPRYGKKNLIPNPKASTSLFHKYTQYRKWMDKEMALYPNNYPPGIDDAQERTLTWNKFDIFVNEADKAHGDFKERYERKVAKPKPKPKPQPRRMMDEPAPERDPDRVELSKPWEKKPRIKTGDTTSSSDDTVPIGKTKKPPPTSKIATRVKNTLEIRLPCTCSPRQTYPRQGSIRPTFATTHTIRIPRTFSQRNTRLQAPYTILSTEKSHDIPETTKARSTSTTTTTRPWTSLSGGRRRKLGTSKSDA
jgi:hypothetical protein